MKTVILARHAEAESVIATTDHARPLSSTGKQEAYSVSKQIAAYGLLIDAVVCSTAARAMETAHIFLPNILLTKHDLIPEPELYNASSDLLLSLIHQLPPMWDTVMIVGHNPGISQYAQQCIGINIHFATANVCCISAAASKWEDWMVAAKKMNFNVQPLAGNV